MKLVRSVEAIESAGLGAGNNFTIAASAKAFEVLSSNLYQNKTLAVIRELTCNAVDAHKVTGQPISNIELHLPTLSEPWFSVRDYGPGLSQQDCLILYTTYFQSTKDGNNDAIGGFGLGSKSPFALVEQFTVTSWHGGFKSIYVMYKEDGLPKVNLISSMPSAEPAGLEVKLALTGAHTTFMQEAKEFFKWWPEHPKGLKAIFPAPTAWWLCDTCWYASPTLVNGIPAGVILDAINPLNSNAWHKITKVLMGGVAYDLNLHNVPNLPADIQQLLSKCSLVLHFNIGEVEISPSREMLSYTKATQQILHKRITEFVNEYRTHLVGEINKALSIATTYNEALRHWQTFMTSSKYQFNISLIKPNWKGKPLPEKFNVYNKVCNLTTDFKNLLPNFVYLYRSRLSKLYTFRTYNIAKAVLDDDSLYIANPTTGTFNIYSEIFWVEGQKLTLKIQQNIRYYLQQKRQEQGKVSYPLHVVYVNKTNALTYASLNKIAEDSGFAKVIDVTTLPDAPSVSTNVVPTSAPRTPFYHVTFKNDSNYAITKSTSKLEDTNIRDCFYVEINRNEFVDLFVVKLFKKLEHSKFLTTVNSVELGFTQAQLKSKKLTNLLTTRNIQFLTTNALEKLIDKVALENYVKNKHLANYFGLNLFSAHKLASIIYTAKQDGTLKQLTVEELKNKFREFIIPAYDTNFIDWLPASWQVMKDAHAAAELSLQKIKQDANTVLQAHPMLEFVWRDRISPLTDAEFSTILNYIRA